MGGADTQEKFAAIRARLGAFYKRHEIDFWLRAPHPQLGGKRACDLINSGQASEVEAVIDRLESGAYL